MKQWLIYKHTSLKSGKSYIGMTSSAAGTRWNEHVYEAHNGSTRHFHRAINLYGIDNWLHEELAGSIDTIEEAYNLEKYFIKLHNTFENGYNLNEGGQGNTGLKSKEYFINHTWVHVDYGTRQCTAVELIIEFGLSRHLMYNYLHNKKTSKAIKQVSGWIIKGRHSTPKKKVSKKDIITVYKDTDTKFTGTVQEFSLLIGKEVKYIGKMLKGKYKSICGWRLTKAPYVYKTSSKAVYEYDKVTLKLLNIFDSSRATSEFLKLPRKDTMSEWLCINTVKEHKDKLYSYKKLEQAGDNNLGVYK